MANDMKMENRAQKILRYTEKAAADLQNILNEHTDKIHDVDTGIITRRLKDGSIVVCDQSGHKAPHWYELDTTEWCDEGDAGETRLKKTRGTVWVVRSDVAQLCTFETKSKADQFYQKQLSLNLMASQPVRYLDGQPQIHDA
jgi:hypothetical protein